VGGGGGGGGGREMFNLDHTVIEFKICYSCSRVLNFL